MKYAIIALNVLLAGCGSTVVKDRPVRVNVPVVQPCVGQRPDPVPTLKQAYPDSVWRSMDARQKAAAVALHAGKLRAYGEQLDAATASCP